jgi:hypothetical protein
MSKTVLCLVCVYIRENVDGFVSPIKFSYVCCTHINDVIVCLVVTCVQTLMASLLVMAKLA